MSTKKLIAAASIAGGVAIGSIAGALVGAPNTSGAQESTTETTTDDAAAPADAPERVRPNHLAVAAEAIGISEDELRAALDADDTTSIADVATANGVDPEVVIDAIVAAATEDIDARITDLVNRDGGPREGGPGGHFGGRGGAGRLSLEVAATTIGISADDLRTALEGGQSIAEVATANGVDPQAVIDALVADANARIDEAVAAGDLDADRAETIKAELAERITERVNQAGLGGGRGPGGPGGPGFGHGPMDEVPADD